MARRDDRTAPGKTPGDPDAFRRVAPVIVATATVVALVVDPGPALRNVAVVIPALVFGLWAWLRVVPVTVVVGTVVVVLPVALWSGALEPALFVASMAAMAVWEASPRVALVGGLAVAALPGTLALARPELHISAGIWTMGIALPWLFGRTLRAQITLAAQLDAARQELARRAVVDERRRIARDVHDMVGHGLVALMIHLTGARHVLTRDPAAAEEALADAEAAGRRSLMDLRRTIGMLRSDDEEDDHDATPVVGAGDVGDAVTAARATGMDANYQVTGDTGRIEPVVVLSLRRVVEEALANARRHAPTATTGVQLHVGGEAVELRVETIGPAATPAGDDAGDSGRPRYGIIGMRERMATVGGRLDAGPTRRGWLVTAAAPLGPAELAEPGQDVPDQGQGHRDEEDDR